MSIVWFWHYLGREQNCEEKFRTYRHINVKTLKLELFLKNYGKVYRHCKESNEEVKRRILAEKILIIRTGKRGQVVWSYDEYVGRAMADIQVDTTRKTEEGKTVKTLKRWSTRKHRAMRTGSGGGLDRYRSVSYTHLDVYKRQVQKQCSFIHSGCICRWSGWQQA